MLAVAARRTSALPRTLLAVLGLGLSIVACGSDGAAAPGTVATTAPAPAPQGVQRIAPDAAYRLLQEQPGVITVIDVRTPDEFASGHLDGAVDIDLEGGGFSAAIAGLPKDAAYLVYCHSGRRSALAAQAMSDAGFTNVYDLGGIVAWQAAGFPIVTG